MKRLTMLLLVLFLLAGCAENEQEMQTPEAVPAGSSAAVEVPAETQPRAEETAEPETQAQQIRQDFVPTSLSMQSMLYSGTMMTQHGDRWYSSYDEWGYARMGYTEDQGETWVELRRNFADSVYVIDDMLYCNYASGDVLGLFRSDLEGNNVKCLLPRKKGSYDDTVQYWDGWFYYCNTDGAHQYCRFPLEGGEPEILTEEEIWYPVIHDGWLLFQNDPDKMSLYWMNLEDSRRYKLNDAYSFHPYFDGESIFYLRAETPEDVTQGRYQIWRMDPDGSNDRCIMETPGNCSNFLVTEDAVYFSPDSTAEGLWIMDHDGGNLRPFLDQKNMVRSRYLDDYILFQISDGVYARGQYAVPRTGGEIIKLSK